MGYREVQVTAVDQRHLSPSTLMTGATTAGKTWTLRARKR